MEHARSTAVCATPLGKRRLPRQHLSWRRCSVPTQRSCCARPRRQRVSPPTPKRALYELPLSVGMRPRPEKLCTKRRCRRAPPMRATLRDSRARGPNPRNHPKPAPITQRRPREHTSNVNPIKSLIMISIRAQNKQRLRSKYCKSRSRHRGTTSGAERLPRQGSDSDTGDGPERAHDAMILYPPPG